MAILDGFLVATILTGAGALLAQRLLRRGQPSKQASQAPVVLKGALSEGLARAQQKRCH